MIIIYRYLKLKRLKRHKLNEKANNIKWENKREVKLLRADSDKNDGRENRKDNTPAQRGY